MAKLLTKAITPYIRVKLDPHVHAELLKRADKACRKPSEEIRFMVTETILGDEKAKKDLAEFLVQFTRNQKRRAQKKQHETLDKDTTTTRLTSKR